MALGYTTKLKKDSQTGLTYKGQEIILMGKRGRPVQQSRATAPGYYSEEKKLEVATMYAACGNTSKVSELARVPESTIKKWRNEGWFLEILDEVRQENNDKLDKKFDSVIDDSIDQILDRVQNGNQQLNQKTGEIVRVPASLRELVNAHASVLEKRELLRGKPTSRSSSGNDANKLEKLAEQFIKIATGRKIKPENIIDVEVVNELPKSESQGQTPPGQEINA